MTARRAERSAAEQAQQLQVSETRRQREHEQMLAQITRTERWLDEGCGPALSQLWVYTFNICAFAGEAASIIATMDRPATVAACETFTHRIFEIGEDGTVTSRASGMRGWVRPEYAQNTVRCSMLPLTATEPSRTF